MSKKMTRVKVMTAGAVAAGLLSLTVAAMPSSASEADGSDRQPVAAQAAAAKAKAAKAAKAAKSKAAFPQEVSGSPSSPLTRVSDFFGAYIDARKDAPNVEGSAAMSSVLRRHYLSSGLDETLMDWERRYNADGVLRSQKVPVKWTVTDNGNGDNYSAVTTLTWADGTKTKLSVLASRDAKKILSIEPIEW
ncbi:hypothetical protein [Streptomyces sp. NPDC018031]|uniref:hypothetical protein n=1 Tax=Streptomyces sp. NPDC018031 TaxID=3365033 RepID=UPI0037A64F91